MLTKIPLLMLEAHWPVMWPCLKDALPSVSDVDSENNIRLRILEGTMLAWVAHEKITVDSPPLAYAITCAERDRYTGKWSMVLYAVASVSDETISDNLIKECFLVMMEHTRIHKCDSLVAYTKNPRILQWGEMTNAEVSHILSWEVT